MNQEQLPQSAKQQPASAEEIRPFPPSSGKRLVLLLGLGLAILILIGIARLSLLKSALAKFEPIHPPKTVPLPTSSAKISEHATEGPSVMTLQQQASPSADALAQNFLAEFEKSVWNAPLQDWSRLHPDIPCEPFRGRMVGAGADRQWAHRCSTGGQREAARWLFYVFSLQEPVARPEQFNVTTPPLLADPPGVLQNLLSHPIFPPFCPVAELTIPQP